MKKIILILFLCLSTIFYAECKVEQTDYFKNIFGKDTTNTMFFVELRQYNEKNIMFIKDGNLYVRGKKFITVDPVKFNSLDYGYYAIDNTIYFLNKKLMDYNGKIDKLRTYEVHNTLKENKNLDCIGGDIGMNDFYLKVLNGKILYKNGNTLGK